VHNPNGDFGLNDTSLLNEADKKYTFSGIGNYNPKLFSFLESGKSSLTPLLRQEIKNKKIYGEIHYGDWHDIGTQKRLQNINNRIKID